MKPEIDQKQFISMLEEHKKLMYKVSNTYCQYVEDRKDLFQEITIQLWKSWNTYNSKYKLTTWIYRIALNTAISFYRKESRRQKTVAPYPVSILEFQEEPPDPGQQENARLLYQCIDQLNELNKALIILYLDDNSYQEIADILGISVTNVATKINRIKLKLKQHFESHKQL